MLMVVSKVPGVCRVAAAVLTASAVAALATSCGSVSDVHSAKYCALMPDSVGLYVGNPVTQMGYPVGIVDTITPDTANVRVDFTITGVRKLPRDVKAVTRSESILADRSLELVGNYESGPVLPAGECIPLGRSSTPKSLSQVIGSATNLINAISPEGSTNVSDAVRGLDNTLHNTGGRINQLLSTSSALLDNPDPAISDIGSIISNLAELTSWIQQNGGLLKQALIDAQQIGPDLVKALDGGRRLIEPLDLVIPAPLDVELNLGDEIQITLDTVAVALGKMSPHATWIANLLNPVPWWINTLANHFNNHQFSISYRPPMFRIRTPDGLAMCGIMNASKPGSCADVAGQPYAVDVALLQYVLTEASR